MDVGVAGKILESLSARAMGMGLRAPLAAPTSPGSQPPTPPRTPLSPHKATSSPVPTNRPSVPKVPSVESMAAKFANLASNNNTRIFFSRKLNHRLGLARRVTARIFLAPRLLMSQMPKLLKRRDRLDKIGHGWFRHRMPVV
ncbi:hypothetical protein J6590_027198 [Homalodisca vitripennis]|nr:hypothetical protein J6590_027198 [Homalodisca vitripennis]